MMILRLFSDLLIGIFLFWVVLLAYSKYTNQPLYTSPQFREYIETFKDNAEKYGKDPDYYKLTTIMSPFLDSGLAGVCYPSMNLVVISKNVWDNISDDIREALLYHEWAHCTMLRDHTEDRLEIFPYERCPVSLMYPSIDLLITCYPKYKDAYIKELFTNPFNYRTFRRRMK